MLSRFVDGLNLANWCLGDLILGQLNLPGECHLVFYWLTELGGSVAPSDLLIDQLN